MPFCVFPANTGYEQTKAAGGRFFLRKTRGSPRNPYGPDSPNLVLDQKQLGQAVRVSVGAPDAYVPRVPSLDTEAVIQSEERLEFQAQKSAAGVFSFSVKRASNGVRIWDTSIGERGCLADSRPVKLNIDWVQRLGRANKKVS